jgi:hypothetical protein
MADHRDVFITADQVFDHRHLIFGKQLGVDLIDADRSGDGVCRPLIVASEHRDALDAGLSQLLDGGQHFLTHFVGKRQEAADMLILAEHDDARAVALHVFELLVHLGRFLAAFFEQAMRAQPNHPAADVRGGPLPWHRLIIVGRRRLDPARIRCP